MIFISVTRLRIRSWRAMPAFAWHVLRVVRQARTAPGSIEVELLADARRTFWTCSVWRGEAAMRDFMLSGAHRAVMPRLAGWCDEASVVHWAQIASELPGWDEIWRRMAEQGRPSPVDHPSPAHLAFEIAPIRR
ncbi:antibiotic biosynthesis monooxygenase [Iodidimonas sp. SYSU 1G8]|uniref:DUF3291 domain-containing protein n=1 Tax=Iodidimonas sp. SYSU 1G8 TaxID=3133967 RepID=UPI0031FEC3BC